MSIRIDGARAVAEPSPESCSVGFAAASPEAVIAQASLHLEESAERAREGERSQRQVRSQARRAEIQDRKKAARMELGAACVQAGGQAASGAASAASSTQALKDLKQPNLSNQQLAEVDASQKRAQGYGSVAEAAGTLGAAGLRFAGSNATSEAELHSLAADQAAEALEEHRASREQLTRLAERAADHVAQISDAKHQAAMAALRG